jgi:hypothetical protein
MDVTVLCSGEHVNHITLREQTQPAETYMFDCVVCTLRNCVLCEQDGKIVSVVLCQSNWQ